MTVAAPTARSAAVSRRHQSGTTEARRPTARRTAPGTTHGASSVQKSRAMDQPLNAYSDEYGYVSEALRTRPMNAPGVIPKGNASRSIVASAAPAERTSGRQ